jgi:tRNA (guanine-N7-)-methyltransferase
MHPQRHIRSFVLRAGRVTAAQERALAELWPSYGLDFTGGALDLDLAFGRGTDSALPAQRCLEIGFGTGEVIGALAEANPHIDYLGIEVHRSGVGRLLLHAARANLENLRIVCHDAVEVLTRSIANETFDQVLVFFPDPWHKKRHHKRRLIDAAFAALLGDKLRRGGILRLATDWQEYAEQMLTVLNASNVAANDWDMAYGTSPTAGGRTDAVDFPALGPSRLLTAVEHQLRKLPRMPSMMN